MNELEKISASGRRAASAGDWNHVSLCGIEIRRRAPGDPDGPFLLGLSQKAAGQAQSASKFFSEVLELDSGRYDAAVELAWQQILMNRHGEASEMLDRYSAQLTNSPIYLDLAGQGYMRLARYRAAWRLFEKARQLQPNVDRFQANAAACAIYLGNVEEARSIFRKLLKRQPSHQRYHYELAQLGRATNDKHIKQMLSLLRKADPDPTRNIFLFYALGKELEDLGRWDQAFEYYEKGGTAARSTMSYDVALDVDVMDKIIAVCTADWLSDGAEVEETGKTPIFVVGLPRTGTTLTERILSSHSQVESIGETQILHMILRRLSGVAKGADYTAEIVEHAARAPASLIAKEYLDSVSYRLGEKPFILDKLPENVLHLGFIAKAWPNARMIHVRRNPMDACFAMYKQSYFRFSYSLEDLARYYLAYDRLSGHWRKVLGGRMVECEYEDLVGNQDDATRRLLQGVGLPFEDACLDFEQNVSPIATASSVQVRERAHTRSVGKWRKFARQLEPLRAQLEAGGVTL